MDHLRLAVTPVPPDAGAGFQVLMFVNDVEMAGAGAGLGMDPYDVLVPDNKFLPGDEPRTFGVARCVCGVYGCGATDVTVSVEGDAVLWVWSLETPINRPATFPRDAYLQEVRRLADDHSWETPDRVAGRLVLTGLDVALLAFHGLRPVFVENDWKAPHLFKACLNFDSGYQIFLRFPWGDDPPERLAKRVLGVLNDPRGPKCWTATWHGMFPGNRDHPPRVAQPGWSREPV